MNIGRQIIVLLVVFVIVAVYCFSLFGGYEGVGDGNDYAGMARNLVTGKGFLVGHVYPLALVFNPNIPQPDNIWAPGYPVYLAAWFAVLGASDHAAIVAAIFAAWLFILATYFLGRRIVGETMGLLSAVFVGLSQVVFYAVIEGTPEVLCGALLTFSVLLLIERQSLIAAVGSAFFFALAVLTRYQIAIVAIPLAVFFIGQKNKTLMLWIASIFAALLPWLIRNWVVLGNPIFTLQAYGEFTKGMGRFDDFYYTYRSFAPMTLSYTLHQFPFDLAKKFVGGLIFFAGAFPIRFNYLGIIPFFFGLAKITTVGGAQRKMLLFAFISSLLIIMLSSLDGHHDRHLLPLQAFFAIGMFVGGVVLARGLGFYKYRLALIIGTFVLFIPSRSPVQEMRLAQTARQCRAEKAAYESIAQMVGSKEVVISDASDAVWWYADRKSVWLPVLYNDLKILAEKDNYRYLYLSRPIDFYLTLNDQDARDFASLAEEETTFPGPGSLFILYPERTMSKAQAM